MKQLLAVLLCTFVFISVSSGQNAAEKAATEAANHWLSVVDGGDYGASWQAAAPMFKAAVSKDQWSQALRATRTPLGKVISRTVKSATYKTSLPGAPDGKYVVIQYESSFEHKRTAIETVTPSQGDDGQWRVSGYFIR